MYVNRKKNNYSKGSTKVEILLVLKNTGNYLIRKSNCLIEKDILAFSMFVFVLQVYINYS